jgi:lysozyme
VTAEEYIKANEGCRLEAYEDPPGSGEYSIGYGHHTPGITPAMMITQERAEEFFAADFEDAVKEALAALGPASWVRLDPVRQAVLIDMAYNLGLNGLLEFVHMLGAIRMQDWLQAKHECIASLADKQEPLRMARNAQMLLTGEWPA